MLAIYLLLQLAVTAADSWLLLAADSWLLLPIAAC